MGLAVILDALADQLPGGTDTKIGDQYVRASIVGPRVVFVPIDETYLPPRGQGGMGGPGTTSPVTDPQPFATAGAAVEMHVHAAKFGEAEQLKLELMRALQLIAPGSFTMERGSWLTFEAEQNISGYRFLLVVRFLIPVTRRPTTRAVVTDLPTAAHFNDHAETAP